MSWYLDLSLLVAALLWASSNHQVVQNFGTDTGVSLVSDINCHGDVHDGLLHHLQHGNGCLITGGSQRRSPANCIAICNPHNSAPRTQRLQGWLK